MVQKQFSRKSSSQVKTPSSKTGTPVKKNPPGTKKDKIKIFSEAKANRYFILFFFVFAFVLYGNTTWNKWAVDDELVTGPDNELVAQGFKAIPEIFSTPYVSKSGNIGSQNADYRPIVKLTFAIEYGLWGEKPGVSHGINVLIYFSLILLLFFVLKNLLKAYNVLFPFLITLVFMVHPIHTEVVASLKNRDEMLAFMCGLGGLHFFLKYADTHKKRYFIFALITFFVGYLSKSSILPFLAIYPLTLYFFKEMEGKKFIWIFLSILFVAILAYVGPRLFLLQDVTRSNSFIENPLYFEKNFWIRTGTALVSLLFYLKMLIYPYPLLYYYGYDMIPMTNWGNLWVWLSFFLYGGMLIYALMKFREKHLMSYAILVYLIFISMYANIVSPVVGIVGERFVFAGSLGFCIALVFLIFRVFRTDPKNLTIEFPERVRIILLIVILVVPSGYLVIKRNRAWRNLYDLCARDVSHLDRSAKANLQYAGVLLNRIYKANDEDRQMMIQAYAPTVVTYFRKSLDIYPDSYETLNDLATIYLNFGQYPDSAMLYLRRAVKIEPDLRPAYVNMGLAYRQMKKYDSAIHCYESILKVDPMEMKAIAAIANIYNEMGDLNKAIELNQEIIRKAPESDVPFRNLGNYYMQRADTATAVQYWEQAAKLSPSYDVLMQLYSLYRIKGDMEKAGYYYDQATEVQQKSQRKKR
jgi:tetratricopeptide (TPR) repeat protein